MVPCPYGACQTGEEESVLMSSPTQKVSPDAIRRLWLVVALAASVLLVVGCDGRQAAEPTVPPPLAIEVDVISNTLRTQDGMVMVYVPAGTFTMGADLAPDDQSPAHDVTLDAFWLDQTEMTNAQYTLCVAAGVCAAGEYTTDRDLNAGVQPVVGVSWYDAESYCSWVGGRLPTEAEWEYAARGPESRTYPWGEEQRAGLANCSEDDCADGFNATAPVGTFADGASWVGAVDMAGNVWEWVNDWYRGGYYGWSPAENPPGPETGNAKVLRGGSWEYNWANVRSRIRSGAGPGFRNDHVGFRCATDAE